MHIPLSRTFKTYLKEKQFNRNLVENNWTFSPFRKSMLLNEIPDWEQYYLPINIKNLTVLDVGAGEGESAHFFLEHGAKKSSALNLTPSVFQTSFKTVNITTLFQSSNLTQTSSSHPFNSIS